jgi:hypothetical protein
LFLEVSNKEINEEKNYLNRRCIYATNHFFKIFSSPLEITFDNNIKSKHIKKFILRVNFIPTSRILVDEEENDF